MLNLITDVPGLAVGHADDFRLLSGVTVVVPDQPAVASVSVLGGAPAGRDLGCLEPDAIVPTIDALVLSGGSGFGLDAASGVQAWLREQGRGFAVGAARVPIVPQAICFDLLNGGDKAWGRFPPYRDLGYAAAAAARSGGFSLGSVGGGLGATTASLKGGLGSASAITRSGHTVGALAVVNALGSATIGAGPHFWAGFLERDGEFGGHGLPQRISDAETAPVWKGQGRLATTIAIVATDATVTKAEAKRIAIAANDGLARALRLTHAALDGDTVFVLSTGRRPLGRPHDDLIDLGITAADCLARAVARGVYEATDPGHGYSGPPAYRAKHPG
jgi:L-aminopeptidase/D-esterase-like protein